MSYTISVAAPQPPSFRQTVLSVGLAPVYCAELCDDAEEPVSAEHFPDQPWPESVIHLYHRGMSIRGVEVSYEKNEFAVRFMTLSSPGDYELGLKLLDAVAAQSKSDLQNEDGETVPREKLHERHNAVWIRGQNLAGLNMMVTVSKEGNAVSMGGFRHNIHLGPRMFDELRNAGPADALLDRFLERARRIQYLDEQFSVANVMSVTERDGRKYTSVVCCHKVDRFFPHAEYVMVGPLADETMIFVEYAKFPALLPDRCELVDEHQFTMKAISDEEWTALIERARPVAAFVVGGAQENKKKWWQFWK